MRDRFDPKRHVGRLRRLDSEWYRGQAFVHWSMALKDRATGWLDPLHHAHVREWLCHALGRHALMCPAYCLMPDHGHFVMVGISPASDQCAAVADFRQVWQEALTGRDHQLQRQPFDHVLREDERRHGAFDIVAQYVLDNPVRAGLVADWKTYPFSGAVVPGYPEMDPREPDYWDRFWRLYAYLVARNFGDAR